MSVGCSRTHKGVASAREKICTVNYQFEVIETPGHSEGHIAVVELSKGWCFSGDLFYGEKPKVTHSKANITETISSMKKLAALKDP